MTQNGSLESNTRIGRPPSWIFKIKFLTASALERYVLHHRANFREISVILLKSAIAIASDGQIKSWFDLNHDWITCSDLIWEKRFDFKVCWFDLWLLDLICNLSKSQTEQVRIAVSSLDYLFCSLALLDPRVGHTMDVLSPFIRVLCHSDWLFHGESCPRLDVVHPGRVWPSSPTCIWHCSLHYLIIQAGPLFPHGITIVC